MSDQKAEFDAPPPEELDPTLQPEPGEVEQAPPPEPEAEPAKAESEKQDKYVPLSALQEARREAKETKNRLAEVERIASERFRFFEQQLHERENARRQPAEPEIVVPNKEENYAGWLEAQIQLSNRQVAQQAKQLQEWQSERQQAHQMTAQEQQEQQLVNAYATDARNFSRENTDWGNVYNTWTQTKLEDWTNAGYTVAEAQSNLRMEERALVMGALRSGISPAQAVYTVARRYVASSPAAQAAETPRAPNGQFVPQKPLPAAPKSLGAARGAPGGQSDTADLLKMSNDEFYAKYSGDNWRKLMSERA